MLAALTLHDGLCDPVEYDKTLIAVLDALARNDEDRRVERRHLQRSSLVIAGN